MKRFKSLAGILFAVVLSSCSTIRIQYDYDQRVDFMAIKTFGWFAQPETYPNNAAEALAENSLLDKRIKKAVNIQLINLGLQMEKEKPDVLVTYHTGLKDKLDFQGGAGVGHRGRFHGRGVYVDEYKEATLVVDILDADSKDLIWRGIAVSKVGQELEPAEFEKTLNKAVKKMFQKLASQAS